MFPGPRSSHFFDPKSKEGGSNRAYVNRSVGSRIFFVALAFMAGACSSAGNAGRTGAGGGGAGPAAARRGVPGGPATQPAARAVAERAAGEARERAPAVTVARARRQQERPETQTRRPLMERPAPTPARTTATRSTEARTRPARTRCACCSSATASPSTTTSTSGCRTSPPADAKIQTRRLGHGMTLQWHWENDAQPAIQNGWAAGVPWTHVVLQGYSSEPLNTDGSPAPATSSFQVYTAKLAQAIKTAKATPVMMETWAYRACFASSRPCGEKARTRCRTGCSPAIRQRPT